VLRRITRHRVPTDNENVDLTLHHVAWIFITLGVFVLAWAGHDFLAGQTRVENHTTFPGDAVQRESDPERFRRLTMANLIGALVSIGFGVGLLVVG
jgi:hypothetical protein